MNPQDTGHFDPPAAPHGSDTVTSDLAAIAKLAQETLSKPIRIKVNALPGFTVSYRTDMEADELEKIYKRARKRVNGNWESNQIGAHRQILAEACEGIFQDGVAKLNSDGDVVTFRDPELHEAFGFVPPDTVELVGAFFKGRDGEIGGHVQAVLQAAGFGADVEVEDEPDPTKGD